ncbi:MAG: DUF1684 domain-containing protein, partial [Acidobacteriota bacterium]|nr:DUF1684 domain-containing protein [Acidobacteriota bacterium]
MKRFALAFAAVLLASSCREEPYVTSYAAPAPAEHQKEVREWQAKRLQRLQAPDSWLTLVGLFWLNEGPNDVTLHNAQKVHLVRSGTNATLEPYAPMTVDGKPLSGPTPLRNDAEKDGPTIVQMGSVRFQVIKRGERLGLRVKDAQSPTRTHFLGLTYFPISEKWRVVARFEPYTPTKKIPITDVTGMTSNMESPGALVFEIDGKEYRIDPVLEEGEED